MLIFCDIMTKMIIIYSVNSHPEISLKNGDDQPAGGAIREKRGLSKSFGYIAGNHECPWKTAANSSVSCLDIIPLNKLKIFNFVN